MTPKKRSIGSNHRWRAYTAAAVALAVSIGGGTAVRGTTEPPADETSTAATEGGGDTSVTPAEPGGLLERAREGGIRIGFANERPYGFEGDDGPTGEAPEVAMVVLERMGITEVEGVVVDFGALIGGLNADRFDVIAAGMFINAERAEQVLFSDPDYCGTSAFAVEEGNPEGLTDFASVTETGATIGVLSGAVEDGYAVDSGVPDDQISRFDTTPDLFDALSAERIDAVALTAITVREQVAELDGFEATDGFVPVIDGVEQLGCGGYAFRMEDQEFRDEFNRVLNEMKENDEILPIVEEFGFTSAEIDAAVGVTVEDLIAPAPEGSMLEGSMPEGSMPEGSMPATSAPA